MRQLSSEQSALPGRRLGCRVPQQWRSWCWRSLGGGALGIGLGCGLCGLGCGAPDGGTAGGTTTSGAPLEGSTGAPATPAARCELPNAGYAGDCNDCLAARCCEPIEACKSDAECAQQLSCEVECQYDADPGACVDRCFEAGMHRLYLPYDDCSFADCRASCWS